MRGLSMNPRRIHRANPALGMRGFLVRALPFQQVHFVGKYGIAVAEKGDDDAEADGSFCGSVRDDKQSEDLSRDITENAGEKDQVDIDGVEDEFDGHQDDDNVAARDHANASDQKQRQAKK